MGIAALVLGIISIIVGFIPFCGAIAYVPAGVGLVLGIVDIVLKSKKGEKKGMAIAGTVLSGLALLIITFYLFILSAAIATTDYNSLTNELMNELENYDYNY